MAGNNYILKTESGEVLCNRMIFAQSMIERMKGLMFSIELPNCDGLMLRPCNSIHTFFMLYKIDVLFLDRELKIVKVIYNLSPWRMTWIYFNSYQVLEMKAGMLKKDLKIGEKLEAICIN